MSLGNGMGRIVRLDCRRRTSSEILREISPRLKKNGSEDNRLLLYIENLLDMEDSVAGFLKDLLRHVVEVGARVSIVDRSGCAALFLNILGGGMPLIALSAEADPPHRKRILVVEDHEDSLEFLRTLVESAGHECVTAKSVSEAVRKIDGGRIDLIFLDIVLSNSDGKQVARHVLEKKMKIPIIVVSAYLDRWDEATYEQLRIKRRIAKPYRVNDILDAIRSA